MGSKLHLTLITVFIIFAIGTGGAIEFTKKKKGDPAEIITDLLHKGWTMQEEEAGPPLLWQGNQTCRFFKLNNPTVTYHHPTGNFDYNPSHTFWLCASDFYGSQFSIETTEQRYPANYTADGPADILFHYSMGENDWGAAPDDVAKALGLEKPKKEKVLCQNVIKALVGVNIPVGAEIKCEGATTASIILSIGGGKDLTVEDVNKLTDAVARSLIKVFPEKRRIVAHRTYGTAYDTTIVDFKPKLW